MTKKEYANRYYNEMKEAWRRETVCETITGICWAIAKDPTQGNRMKVIRLEELFKAYQRVQKENRYGGE